MKRIKYPLWDKTPGSANYEPWIEHFIPDEKKSESAILIIPGSGYHSDPDLPKQEGERVALYYCEKGINVFVLRYRVAPDGYPMPLLDGRRAVRYIRFNSESLGIDKNKLAAIGYSSGGHLTASLFAYNDKLEYEDIDDIDNECCVPNFQILSYPVISLDKDNEYSHKGSVTNLLEDKYDELESKLSLEKSTVKCTAPTFIWHNFDDKAVSVINSLKYAEYLKKFGCSVEMHIFPDGGHGIGLPVEDSKIMKHAGIWIELLDKWLDYHEFF